MEVVWKQQYNLWGERVVGRKRKEVDRETETTGEGYQALVNTQMIDFGTCRDYGKDINSMEDAKARRRFTKLGTTVSPWRTKI